VRQPGEEIHSAGIISAEEIHSLGPGMELSELMQEAQQRGLIERAAISTVVQNVSEGRDGFGEEHYVGLWRRRLGRETEGGATSENGAPRAKYKRLWNGTMVLDTTGNDDSENERASAISESAEHGRTGQDDSENKRADDSATTEASYIYSDKPGGQRAGWSPPAHGGETLEQLRVRFGRPHARTRLEAMGLTRTDPDGREKYIPKVRFPTFWDAAFTVVGTFLAMFLPCMFFDVAFGWPANIFAWHVAGPGAVVLLYNILTSKRPLLVGVFVVLIVLVPLAAMTVPS
jgi:hypothetical protein